jgi:hypothetical protein
METRLPVQSPVITPEDFAARLDALWAMVKTIATLRKGFDTEPKEDVQEPVP